MSASRALVSLAARPNCRSESPLVVAVWRPSRAVARPSKLILVSFLVRLCASRRRLATALPQRRCHGLKVQFHAHQGVVHTGGALVVTFLVRLLLSLSCMSSPAARDVVRDVIRDVIRDMTRDAMRDVPRRPCLVMTSRLLYRRTGGVA